jgi:hypothetical protein
VNVIWLQETSNATIILPCQSGRGAARLARLHGVQEVGGSNPLAPTEETLARESLALIIGGRFPIEGTMQIPLWGTRPLAPTEKTPVMESFTYYRSEVTPWGREQQILLPQ